MKSIATLAGWVVIGAVLAFGGQSVWQVYKSRNPVKAEKAEEVAKESIETGKQIAEDAAVRAAEKTLDALNDESKETLTVEPKTAEAAGRVEAPKTSDVAQAAEAPRAAAKVELKEDPEVAINDRLTRIAEGDVKPASTKKPVYTEKDQLEAKKRERKEQVLFQRQVRIIDELLED